MRCLLFSDGGVFGDVCDRFNFEPVMWHQTRRHIHTPFEYAEVEGEGHEIHLNCKVRKGDQKFSPSRALSYRWVPLRPVRHAKKIYIRNIIAAIHIIPIFDWIIHKPTLVWRTLHGWRVDFQKIIKKNNYLQQWIRWDKTPAVLARQCLSHPSSDVDPPHRIFAGCHL